MQSKRGRPTGRVIRGSRRSSGLTHSQRWTGAEWRQVLDAAKREGIVPSEFIRTTVLKAIREAAGQVSPSSSDRPSPLPGSDA